MESHVGKSSPATPPMPNPRLSHTIRTRSHSRGVGSKRTSHRRRRGSSTAESPSDVASGSSPYDQVRPGAATPEQQRGKHTTSAPSPSSSSSSTTTTTPASHLPSRLYNGRRTRSQGPAELVSAFEWEALDIQRRKLGAATPPVSSVGSSPAPLSQDSESLPGLAMSRNRPRGPPVRDRDYGLAANEETDIWNKIIQDLRKAKEKHDKQKALSEQIAALNEKIAREGNKPTLEEINQLDSWYRQLLKLSEEEKAVLQEEPSDVIKNIGLLMALRSASEAEALSRPASAPKTGKFTRVKSSANRSSSVSSSGHARDGGSVKAEDGADGAKGSAAGDRTGQLVVGAEVVFKHNKNKQGVEGEGIQCIIKGISGDGSKRRYDVQDPEPNENGEQGAVYRTTAASLIPIPQVGAQLPTFPVGKQVLARYPDTTTFYRAEVMGAKKDVYRLKFEGEEDDKEMEVDKRFVLEIPSK